MADDLTSDYLSDLSSRYRGAVSDPDLSFDNPTATPQAQFAQATPQLSSRFYDPAGNFRFMGPNPQAPQNQQQSPLLQGQAPIQNLSQLADLAKMTKDLPEDLRTKILSARTGIPLDTQKSLALQNSLLQMRMKHEMEAPQRAQAMQEKQQNYQLRKAQLDDMRTYRQGLTDQGTKFSAMMLRQHIMNLRDQIKTMLPTDPAYKDTIQEYQESIQAFGNMAKGFQQSPQSATRGGVSGGMPGGKQTSGTMNIGGKQVQWTRSPDEEQ